MWEKAEKEEGPYEQKEEEEEMGQQPWNRKEAPHQAVQKQLGRDIPQGILLGGRVSPRGRA